MQYLGFYWGVSAHPLTVSYQMMLGRIQEYGSLGVTGVDGSLHSGTIHGITSLIAGTLLLFGMFKIQSWELI